MLLSFTRGSIGTKDIREFIRKHEMKLHSRDVGAEKKGQGHRGAASVHHVEDIHNVEIDDEYVEMEQALEELRGEDAGEEADQEEWAIDEHEAAEILATMLQSQPKEILHAELEAEKGKGALARLHQLEEGGQGL